MHLDLLFINLVRCRKNEEKQLKAAAFREAISKDTVERIKQMEKEKEERERAMREQLEKKKEAEAKKKMKEEAKALEAELRRQNEEAARQAKIREMVIRSRTFVVLVFSEIASLDLKELNENHFNNLCTYSCFTCYCLLMSLPSW